MQRRDAGCRNLDTQIPPGHHNAVRCRQNFIQIVHALLIFNFGDDFNIVSATLAEHRAYSLYIRRAADKRGSDEIKVVFHAEADIVHVLFREGGKLDVNPGDIDGFIGRQDSSWSLG